MRKIKFKAWIPSAKLMLDEITIYNDGQIGISDSKLHLACDKAGLECDGESIYDKEENHALNLLSGDDWYWIEEGESILLQFTGLKDKNGKEIYEGDIVTCDEYTIIGRPGERFSSFTGYVKYSEQASRYWIMIPYADGKEKYNNLSMGGQYGDENGIQLTSMEVIGNIYENAGLLAATPKIIS